MGEGNAMPGEIDLGLALVPFKLANAAQVMLYGISAYRSTGSI
jgi:hypothetical protein